MLEPPGLSNGRETLLGTQGLSSQTPDTSWGSVYSSDCSKQQVNIRAAGRDWLTQLEETGGFMEEEISGLGLEGLKSLRGLLRQTKMLLALKSRLAAISTF